MSVSPGLAPPGSSTYSSSTLHVGDGTWDASRDSFLLPNIQGLNYATMRYNGMGNRFRSLTEYHNLVMAHGAIAAITFLGIVPASILIASFYHPNPRLALRTHISLQVLTVLLATVVLVLGYFAVGPERSLTNPHHGIGVAIYVSVMIQAIGGWLIHKIEKGKMRYHIPIKLMLHQWVGRAIALLALAQIPIGLTLYGSPLVLFILYALAMAFLLVLYFVLTYQTKKRAAAGYDERGSYVTGTQTEVTDGGDSHHPGRWAALTGAVLGGTGLAALRRRRSDRRADAAGSGVDSRADSGSYLTEKHTDGGYGEHTWRNRLLGGAAGLGAVAAVKHFFNPRRDREAQSDLSSDYRPPRGGPLGGAVTQTSADHLNRMEEGFHLGGVSQRPRTGDDRGVASQANPAPGDFTPRRSRESLGTYSSQRSHDGRGPFAGLAALVGLDRFFGRRRERKEQERVDAERQREYENERVFGAGAEQPFYPGGGPQRNDGVRFDPNASGPPIPPIPPTNARNQNGFGFGRQDQQQPQPPLPPPPTGPPRNMPLGTGPPPRNDRGPTSSQQPSAYDATGYGQRGLPVESNDANAGQTGTGAGPQSTLQQPPAVASPGRERALSSDYNDNGASPPVSVKVNMYNDGRRVTVRRLNQDEAAVERDGARRSSGQGRDAQYGRIRYENAPASQQSQPTTGQAAMGQQYTDPGLQSPQRGAYMSSPSATDAQRASPSAGAGGEYDTGSESYDTNRRRRRAERARAEQARQEARGATGAGRVEFT